MNVSAKWFRKKMTASMVLITVGALSTLLISFGDFEGSSFEKFLSYMIGAIFWLGTLLGYVLLFIANKFRKRNPAAGNEKSYKRRTPGAVSFFSTKEGIAADVAMFVFFIFTIITGREADVINLISASFFILSLQLHAILNGQNYKYMKVLLQNNTLYGK